MQSYREFIESSYNFPSKEFRLADSGLLFNGIDLMELVQKHGTPLRISFLPKIGEKIKEATQYFTNAIETNNYPGKYTYCYCTKPSHFKFILEKTLQKGAQIETSSAFDIEIVNKLFDEGLLTKDHLIVANGYKRPLYLQHLCDLINSGFKNCIPVLDNLSEIQTYNDNVKVPTQLGIRIATDEEPLFPFYTSRLGVRRDDCIKLYEDSIRDNAKFSLKLLHFFINTGIRDTPYYWNELDKFLSTYCALAKECPTLDTIDIGGGFPVKYHLDFSFDYQEITNTIIKTIQEFCLNQGVTPPNIITEFGSFTVAESGAMIYNVLDVKHQNDKETWYMIDGSLITHLPDTWAIKQNYITLALNNWNNSYKMVNLGGLTCDSQDFYNSESHSANVYLPEKNETSQYLGFFHTGAYQEAIGGFGGIQHCLIPHAKHVLIDKDKDGTIFDYLFEDEQDGNSVLNILGY